MLGQCEIMSQLLTWRNKRIACICVDWHMGVFVNAVLLQRIASFHQDVKILAARMHCDPARMVSGFRRLNAPNQREKATVVFAMAPNPIGPHVGRVKKALRRIECHAMDSGHWRVFVVLDIFFQSATAVDAECISEPGIVIERSRVHIVRVSFSCE